MKNTARIIVLLFVSLTSCSKGKQVESPVLPMVREILSDTSSVWNKAIYGYSPKIFRNGGIAVVGQKESALSLAGTLMVSDVFDNGTFAREGDSLADLAGERIDVISDSSLKYGFTHYAIPQRSDSLRNSCIRLTLAAISGKYWSSQYEASADREKIPAKIILLSDVEMALYGADDARDLLSYAGTGVKVIDPVEALVHEAMKRHPKGSQLGIWTSSDTLVCAQYEKRLGSILEKNCGHVIISPEGASFEERFLDYLRKYSMTEKNTSLSAILIDHETGLSMDRKSLDTIIDGIYTTDSEEMVAFRKLLSKDFEFIFAKDAAAEYCYETLRNDKSLSLRIEAPKTNIYSTMTYKGNTYVLK